MYKTIRHGENSLQYTILPQNDDFRMEGKLTTNSSNNTNTNNNNNSNNNNIGGHKTKRGRRRSFFAYLGLLFVCTVIIGAILIPFLVSAECLPNPSDWFIRTKLNEQHDKNYIITNNNNNNNNNLNKTESTIKAYPESNNNQSLTTIENLTTVNNDENLTSDKLFTIPILNEKNQNYLIDKNYNDINNKLIDNLNETGTTIFDINIPVVPPTIKIITTTSTTTTTTIQPTTEALPKTRIVTITSTLPPISTTSKKPIILPVLAKTNSVIKENGKLIDRHTEPKNWIRSHWPFIDPSTYFQWAGYKSEDSVLLPAILGVALIGMILIVTLCLLARNKKTIVASVRKRNRNDIEEAGEDNTTLLTTATQSDEE